ncbi:ABC transporter ATP-binding protein [Variovorax sp. J31P207]|uniref:ABC transporter ATP-binding protein n=1 Tax=Variovorax sp. J31P207 TaxID=3053510 RepID=UPI002574E284|nr:ABC transporter ATP-binding protein [Variovorax sp. J31P207]MDM0071572.1 ABC transporter ATP-binding protein [Variovorax sp. J31P207]
MSTVGTPLQPVLDVRDLQVTFGKRQSPTLAVKGVGFAIGRGETVALVGESGSGKSVTAFSILGLIAHAGGKICSGQILFSSDGGGANDLRHMDEAALRRIRGQQISMIFQEPMTSLNPVMTVGDQIAEVYLLHEKIGRAEALIRAQHMLDAVRMPESARRMRQYPGELSGGMRQRVVIAMAMACKPALLIADEPTTALDVTVQAEILSLIKDMQKETGMSVLFITHDMGVVAEIADRVVVMRHGLVVEEAPCQTLFAAPQQDYTRALLKAVPRLGDGSPEPLAQRGAPVMEVRGISKLFPVKSGFWGRAKANVHAVEGVSFDLMPGETLALVGESGSGKSTTGRLISKLLDVSEGSIRVQGTELTKLPADVMRPHRRDIQMIFQDPYASLNPRLQAWDLVSEPLKIHGGLPEAERRARAADLLEKVGLDRTFLERYAHQFSGGQRQRLCIARALSVKPKIIVADEPVSALDVSVQDKVVRLLQDLQRAEGLAYLFISHDMAVVERISHRVAVMYLGEIVEIGPCAQVLHRPHHPYTRKLLSAVPVPDPTRRKERAVRTAADIPSAIFKSGGRPTSRPLVEVGEGHFARVETT